MKDEQIVTLKEWDWDAQAYVEREYPYGLIKGFIEWMRNTRQWIEDDSGQQVWHKFQRFQESLTDAKADAANVRAEAPTVCPATTKAGNPCKGTPVEGGLCMAHLKAAA